MCRFALVNGPQPQVRATEEESLSRVFLGGHVFCFLFFVKKTSTSNHHRLPSKRRRLLFIVTLQQPSVTLQLPLVARQVPFELRTEILS